jgi:choline dehydrogenase-like flavoprotein
MANAVDYRAVSETLYDAVIVGSGVAGSIVAKELSAQGYRVLILEAGPDRDMTVAGFNTYVEHFHSAVEKDNNAPFPRNPNAPSPRSPDTHKLVPGQPGTSGYFVQQGPLALDSAYIRVAGGTTTHFQSTTLRMLPEDFQLRSRYGQGLDWPISYEDLMPYYRQAEFELGVSADVEDQAYYGIHFEPGYVYPMQKIPISYLDKTVAKGIDGLQVGLDGQTFTLKVRSIPQGRNGIPNPKYDNGKGYVPVGAVSGHQAELGERCQGNANCTPICPVQAKYDGRKTLYKALGTGRVDFLAQAVASQIQIDPTSGRVIRIQFKAYHSLTSPEYETGEVRGKLFVLAANAVENARLMLASGLRSTSGLVGKNLMDHPYLLAWALMPEVTGTMRGPLGTSGIEEFRSGSFRRAQSAFRIDIHNEGWGWATGSPYTDLVDIVDNKNKFGRALRQQLIQRISRQLLLAFMCELPADPSNQVTIDPQYKDQLHNYRPVISFNISDYCLNAIAYARHISQRLFQRLGAEDYTHYDPSDYGYITYQGQGYVFRGGNHFAGTHVMGTSKQNSVVDHRQRSWDHANLYLVGAGSMPSIGSSNTTLTLSALSFLSTKHMFDDLKTL